MLLQKHSGVPATVAIKLLLRQQLEEAATIVPTEGVKRAIIIGTVPFICNIYMSCKQKVLSKFKIKMTAVIEINQIIQKMRMLNPFLQL